VQNFHDVLSSFTYAASGKCDGERRSNGLPSSHYKIDKIGLIYWLMGWEGFVQPSKKPKSMYVKATRSALLFDTVSVIPRSDCCSSMWSDPLCRAGRNTSIQVPIQCKGLGKRQMPKYNLLHVENCTACGEYRAFWRGVGL
jgi:hypothetical protein